MARGWIVPQWSGSQRLNSPTTAWESESQEHFSGTWKAQNKWGRWCGSSSRLKTRERLLCLRSGSAESGLWSFWTTAAAKYVLIKRWPCMFFFTWIILFSSEWVFLCVCATPCQHLFVRLVRWQALHIWMYIVNHAYLNGGYVFSRGSFFPLPLIFLHSTKSWLQHLIHSLSPVLTFKLLLNNIPLFTHAVILYLLICWELTGLVSILSIVTSSSAIDKGVGVSLGHWFHFS